MPHRFIVVAALSFLLTSGLRAAEPSGFEAILRAETRSTFAKIADYVRANPEAGDTGRAWQWLFVTALEHGLEADALPLADEYLQRPMPDPVTGSLAQQTRMFGLARSGRTTEAVQLFQQQLRFARLQNGGVQIELGKRLATQLQMARDFAAARQVYEEISGRFFLNSDVKSLCENRIGRIDLVDQPAPEVGVADTTGQPVHLDSLRDKVVLIDFWATNCPPCLEEMPNLKQLHAEYNAQGFEIVGVSLDGDQTVVDEFVRRAEIPWRMIVSEPDVERLRERYRVRTIPALIIVDQKGVVHQVDVRGGDLRQTIEGLLKK